MEAAKALMDGFKLAKTLKDQLDRIRVSLITDKEDAARQLATYGLLITGRSVSLYKLHVQNGRFYQFTCQGTATLPSNWMPDGDNTASILTVTANLLSFRHQVLDRAIKIRKWTKPNSYTLAKPVDAVYTDIPATITTSTSSPKLLPMASLVISAVMPLLYIDVFLLRSLQLLVLIFAHDRGRNLTEDTASIWISI
ncbi:hypothetical protein FBU30_007291 [Linnemannia zychae]|nr:hypothetical protein FBU30_007291 [Linnemannia zychae]